MRVVIVMYDGVTLLDAVGPAEVLARIPGVQIVWTSASGNSVTTDMGLYFNVQSACDPNVGDILLIPGGPGQELLMENADFLLLLQLAASKVRIVASVCTGSLLLAAAGLLENKQCTSHWAMRERLRMLGACPVSSRVVIDGKYYTAAGVSAGIDLALVIAEILAGKDVRDEIQLILEYSGYEHSFLDVYQRNPEKVQKILSEIRYPHFSENK